MVSNDLFLVKKKKVPARCWESRFIDLFPPVNELAENKLKKTTYQV